MRLRCLLVAIVTVCAACDLSRSPSPTTGAPATTTSVVTTSTAPDTTTTIATLQVRGRVVDGSGTPMPGVRVSLGGIETTTGPHGDFESPGYAGNPMVIQRPGWVAVERVVEDDRYHLVVMEPLRVRGIRVGAGAAGDSAHFQSLLELAAASAINAFVFDTKQEGGEVLYDSAVAEAIRMGAVKEWYDPVARIKQAEEAGIYTITRIVTFEDAAWAASHPDEKLAGPWVDPRAAGIRRYNIDLAVEACALGFDEIQFDYVRFPAGRTAEVSGQLDLPMAERVAAIESFLEEARMALQPMGCAVSADVFAIVVSVVDDQGLGQRPEELSRHLDALSPMVYPSHYSPGWLGFPDPNDHPYAVTADAIDDAMPRIEAGAILRPWLQGFWWTSAQIREAIQAAEDRDVGWIVWNVRSAYDAASFPTDDEVGG